MRAGIATLVALAVVVLGLAPPASASSAYDARIGAGACALLGRVHVAERGCSRDDCVRGAVPANPSYGAEVCRARGGRVYATDVEYRTCRALGRVWIPQVNWCASDPDRTDTVVAHAPQCADGRSTYVLHAETPGHWDECLAPSEVAGYEQLARASGTSLQHVASSRSAVLCAERPAHALADGVCRGGAAKQPGGVLLVGDSIAWRGTDELGPLRPDWTIDGVPSQRLSALDGELDRYLAGHETPTGFVLELGTNAAPGYRRSQLVHSLARLPASTPVMLVLPYRASGGSVSAASTRVARWMRSIAASRPLTCVADWRALVRRTPSVLVDGVHPTSANEGRWARWVSQRWSRCAG